MAKPKVKNEIGTFRAVDLKERVLTVQAEFKLTSTSGTIGSTIALTSAGFRILIKTLWLISNLAPVAL